MKNILIYMAMLWFGSSSAMAQHKDWAQLNRYAQSNQEWIAKPNTGKRVVFLGNSITDNWASMRPDFSHRMDILDEESADKHLTNF